MFQELANVPLRRAIRYAVDNLYRFVESERKRPSVLLQLCPKAYELELRDLLSLDHGPLGRQTAKRAVSNRRKRMAAGLGYLDDDAVHCLSLLAFSPETDANDVAVKRNYERMKRQSTRGKNFRE